jgi:conjugative relaxase-like TrwC/TraI family protein
MHSIASVKSASGAAKYFTKDDFVSGEYYTDEKAGDVSMWGGEAAAAAGLTGTVSQEAFAKALNGELPSGEKVEVREGRRPGFDLTFSAPKSVSVMAYIAGDKRILGPDGAQTKAVQQTMAWVEKNLAAGRITKDGKTETVKTGNLVYALFQHDTSRALDPQAHIHAIVANMTRMPDGKFQALDAEKLWTSNTVIGSIYHSYLRAELEKLGYKTEMEGRHGTFNITGVPKAVLEVFSQRRQDILAIADKLGIKSTQGLRDVTARTRDPKLNVEDREGLQKDWIDKAADLGFNGKDLLAAAEQASKARETSPLERGYQAIVDAVNVARETIGGLLRSPDPLVDRGFVRLAQSTGQANAQLAVASAVRSLNQREAAFDKDQVAKKALDFGLNGVTIDHVEARVEQLIEKVKLLSGEITYQGQKVDAVTTPEALRIEESILARVQAGKDAGAPIVAPSVAPDRLQAASPHPLNEGQLAAATLIVSTTDRIVAVQGIAGAGKSTMLQAVARVVESEGKSVMGLAFQNKMVADMKKGLARPEAIPTREMSVDQMQDSGVKAETIAHFIWHNEKHVTNPNTPEAQARRDELKNTIIVVDETSMVSNRDMLKMLTIAEALGIEKIALIGDRQQLLPIDAGKAFAMMQADKIGMARMDDNLRQQTDQLRTVAALANVGKAGQAMKVLGDKVVEHEDPSAHASDLWLALSPDERANTAIFASGRETRAAINQAVQKGLKDEGTLKGDGQSIAVIQNVNIEREDLRYAKTYEKGQRLEIKGSVPELKLKRGVAEVRRTFANGKVEILKNGKSIKFSPQKIDPMIDKDRMSLATIETIQIHEGDRIRWTDNDKERGIYNASLATIAGIENGKVTVELANKDQVTLEKNDPMMQRMDLAYALNMHMAQGITVNKAIVVMQSFERNLSNQRLFNVGVTRIRLDLTMVVDNQQKLEMQLGKNPGDKTSSLESLGRLDIKGAAVQTKAVDDALTKAMESLDEARSEKILINPANLDMTDLPRMGASTTDYSDGRNLDGEMPSIKDGDDADRRVVRADREDDELGMRPLDMDDLSALPAMLGSGARIRGHPEKNLSLDM